MHLFPSSYFFFQPCSHQTGLFTFCSFTAQFPHASPSPCSQVCTHCTPNYASMPNPARVFQQKSYLVLSYLVSERSGKQNNLLQEPLLWQLCWYHFLLTPTPLSLSSRFFSNIPCLFSPLLFYFLLLNIHLRCFVSMPFLSNLSHMCTWLFTWNAFAQVLLCCQFFVFVLFLMYFFCCHDPFLHCFQKQASLTLFHLHKRLLDAASHLTFLVHILFFSPYRKIKKNGFADGIY